MKPSSEPIWRLGADGWLSEVRHAVSPNHDARPEGTTVRLIVIHAISLPPGKFDGVAVTDFFLNRLSYEADPYFANLVGLRVSAHFFISRQGKVTQFVSCHARAWHAGLSCWQGQQRCNDISVGIELEGDDQTAFATPQYEALNRLLATLRGTYPIEEIVGHLDIAPGRKTDPGPYFDWSRITA